jgi:hypothetical protein
LSHLIAKADVICSLQDQLANMSKEHKRYIDKQEHCLVELDMEKSEKIAVLEDDCNKAVEELHVSTSLASSILFFDFHVAQSFHSIIFQMIVINQQKEYKTQMHRKSLGEKLES